MGSVHEDPAVTWSDGHIVGWGDCAGAGLCDPRPMTWALRSIFVVGGLLTLIGLIMIPLSGPGVLLVSLGVQVLVVGLFLSAVVWLSRRTRNPSDR
jgi:hypothetical protein